ncbi:adoMet-dependent rRNA methyltransferase spb1-like [Rosa rugosa]|uniref:adoMet-dependent rRNA methyltransferase spb1-like n=1 Tax=Rosa rugosa TaxID=74645 RepID=UPI002B417651|nr:adoMet-dependent rRNA methyltransferase spb1-like [Rosa rugosa]
MHTTTQSNVNWVVFGRSKGKDSTSCSGYEDGNTILRKVSSAADFICSEDPLNILGSVTSITFDDVIILCDDLRVLGKQDFRHLLKWLVQIRRALSLSEKADVTTAPDVEKGNKEDDDDRILNEMEEITYTMERKKKREKKLQAKKRAQVSLLLRESFIDSFPSRDRPFMKLFMDTQLFSVHTDLVLSFFQKE